MSTIKSLYQNLIDAIRENATKEKRIIFIGNNYEKSVFCHDVYEKALRVLNHLQSQGFGSGDQMMLLIDKNEYFIYSVWACILGGMTIVPLSTEVTPENIRMLTNVLKILERAGVIISSRIYQDLCSAGEESFLSMIEQAKLKMVFTEDMLNEVHPSDKLHQPNSRDIVAILFSSGSTGDPKGVPQTQDNILQAIGAAIRLHHITTSDIFLGWLPLTHIIGIYLFHFVPLLAGADQIIMDKSYFVQNPVQWIQTAADYKASFMVSPNFGFQHFLQFFNQEQAENWDLSHIRLILNGAEPVSEKIANEFTQTLSAFGLKKQVMCPSYGMTEATITISSFLAADAIKSFKMNRESLSIGSEIKECEEENAPSFVCLGRVVDNLRVKICDSKVQQLQDNTIGYIYIKGRGVAKEYYKNPAATQNAFTLDGWFKTGDIGFIKEKELYITGREKDMVIIHGQNYYLNDVDRIIQSVNGIAKAAACQTMIYELQKEEILLAIKWEKSLEEFVTQIPRIQRVLNTQLGLQCRYIVPMDEIPCTSSGKIQRYKIASLYYKGEFDTVLRKINELQDLDKEDQEADLSDTESKLRNLWSQVLHVKDIKKEDNFFQLGGSSIQIMQLMHMIETQLHCQISYNQFIIHNTVAALAGYINNRKNTLDIYTVKRKAPDKEHLYEPFPLTNIQMAYVLGRNAGMEMGGVGTHHYEEIKMELDIPGFENAIRKLIKRHPSLRTLILENGTQRIMKEIPEYLLQVEDISHLSAIETEDRILKERRRMSHYVFQPGVWPYFEFKALRLNPTDYYLFISIDLLIFDAASLFYFSRELVEYYQHPELELPELQFTFRDYVISLNEITESHLYNRSRSYWLDKLETFPQAPQIPLKTKAVNVMQPHFKRKRRIFQRNVWSEMKRIAQEKNVTTSAILCTAYAEVLSLWSNQKELALNLTIFSRYPFHEDVTSILGDFTSLIILGLDMDPQLSFWQKVEYVQKVTMEALEHRHYDGIEFIREYAKYHNRNARAIMPYVFSSILFDGKSEGWSALGESQMQLSQTSQVYLDNQLMDVEGSLYITWDYVEQLFDEELIDAMFDRYIQMISTIVVQHGYERADLSEIYELPVRLYNLTKEERQSNTLHGLFVRQAEVNADKTAVIEGEKSITYRELNRKSNQMAYYLLMQGIGKNNFIGIIAERKIDTIINILAVIKAGAAYVPIDPKYPEERKEYILANSRCTTILAPDAYEKNNAAGYSTDNLSINYPEETAYVIYTSGSTGKPKGVIITHEAAVNTILDINERFQVNEKDRIIGVSSMCFDLSVYDIFGTLSTGATLVMIPDQRDVFHLISVVSEQKITLWNTVPAIMDMMITYAPMEKQYESLRLVMLSGDWIGLGLPPKITKWFPNAEIISLGGATEASIWSIYYPIKEIKSFWKSIPYGYPLANQQLYILDYQRQLCPPGVPGEIYIGGKGVALGYHHDEVRTKESFLHHSKYGYLYRTGDYGVFHDGYIEFLGRKDNQVKIQGYRIELDEIQNRLIRHPKVKNAVVTVYVDDRNEKHLYACIVPAEEVEGHELRDFLQKDLPEYMIPAYFINIDRIPLTPNGKLDTKSLPLPNQMQRKPEDYATPGNAVEWKLQECWKRVLGIENVGIRDDFFEIGGNSIKAIQLVNLLSRSFYIRVNQIFESRTIEELARNIIVKEDNLKDKLKTLKLKQIQFNTMQAKEMSGQKYGQYLTEIEKYQKMDLSGREAYQNILLTGATGYLGTYILKELLESTGYHIYVTVRGCTVESARGRFEQSAAGYLGEEFFRNYKDRITVILADLAKPCLNMAKESYDGYADIIHCIIHAAANVKHFGILEEFEEVNVRGVERLIAFAQTGIKKDIHYISTNGLSVYDAKDPANALYTECDMDVGQIYDNYYLQTKFEAEKILCKARENGLNVNIYRVGVLVFDSSSGRFQRNIGENAFYNNLRSYIKLGVLPENAFEPLEFSYVDYVSKAIVLLFDKVNLKNEVFHIFNHEKITLSEFAELLKESFRELKTVAFEDYLDTLAQLQEDKEQRAYVEDILFNYGIYESISYLPQIISDKTAGILEQFHFTWKKPDKELLERMLSYCRQVEFI